MKRAAVTDDSVSDREDAMECPGALRRAGQTYAPMLEALERDRQTMLAEDRVFVEHVRPVRKVGR